MTNTLFSRERQACHSSRNYSTLSRSYKSKTAIKKSHIISRTYYKENTNAIEPDFGILFDIDGVIVRGKNVLPNAPHAFQR